jgi:adenylosuccinate synthase
LSLDELKFFPDHHSAREIGVTTGRKRRIGWLDVVLLRYALHLNGATSVAIMKLDILDCLEEIKICVGYKIGEKKINFFPPTASELFAVQPIYEVMPGWKTSTAMARKHKDLPKTARNYLRRIEELCEIKISLVSVGPAREQTLWLESIFTPEVSYTVSH